MDMNRAWRDEFDAAAARPLDLRLRYAFVHTYKPVLDDQPYRSFESTADYRRWCNENLPDCSSARREPSSTASRTPRRMQTCSSRRRCAMGSTLTWCSRQTESNGSRTLGAAALTSTASRSARSTHHREQAGLQPREGPRNPTSAKGLPRVSQRTGSRTPSTPPRTEVSGPRIGTLRSTLRRCRHDARRGHRPAGRGGAGRAESVNPLRRDRRTPGIPDEPEQQVLTGAGGIDRRRVVPDTSGTVRPVAAPWHLPPVLRHPSTLRSSRSAAA